MSRFMLDTNICVELLRGRGKKIFDNMRRFVMDDVAISSITLAELQFGAAKSARREYQAMRVEKFCAPLEILSFDHTAAEVYGTVRFSLEQHGKVIGSLDMLIAAHALAMGRTLVTNNEREFARVEGLKMVNWLK